MLKNVKALSLYNRMRSSVHNGWDQEFIESYYSLNKNINHDIQDSR